MKMDNKVVGGVIILVGVGIAWYGWKKFSS
jgi:hypothetical protein